LGPIGFCSAISELLDLLEECLTAVVFSVALEKRMGIGVQGSDMVVRGFASTFLLGLCLWFLVFCVDSNCRLNSLEI
jgi:hypothetical protein